MKEKIAWIIKSWLCDDDGSLSLTRSIIVLFAIAFLVGTGVDIWLTYHKVVWTNYPTFATITGGGAIGAKIGDRIAGHVTSTWQANVNAKIGSKTKEG